MSGRRSVLASGPQPAYDLLLDTLGLYKRYPALFFVLAAAVIVPYEAIVWAATGTGGFSRANAGAAAEFLLTLISWFLVRPLVSALHVRAVAEVRRGGEPRIGPVALQGLRVLPVVVAATIIAWFGILLGFLALILPGVILFLRWVVVSQVAAIEHEGWLPALRRSRQLTSGHYWHIAAFYVMVGVIVTAPFLIGGAAFGHHNTSAASFVVGLAVEIATASFSALAFALLYYDLKAHSDAQPQPASGASSPPSDPSQIAPPSLDPRHYSDADRPKGWYVDPSSPGRMLYWHGGDPLGWQGATRTPRKIRRAWETKNNG